MINDKIFENLNDRQLEAVNYLDGPLLVMAGAGSGKTRVLTCRIANLLAHGVKPWNILAITFTNKAANEMKSRAASMIGSPARDVWLSTFHSFCARILRSDVGNTNLRSRSFVIYDTADSRALIKKIIDELNLDEQIFMPAAVQGKISAIKNIQLLTAAEYKELIFTDKTRRDFDRQFALVYEAYEKNMLENNALDFDDLLLVAVRMLRDYPDIRRKYQDRFRYILVDEYQDTNAAQYLLTKLLAAAHHNLCVVGDADQSIYGFRGADIRNILSFERDYPEAKVVLLEQNYRSTKTILNAANSVIGNNVDRKPKRLWSDNAVGDPLTLLENMNEHAEAQRIVGEIKLLVRQGFTYKNIALLYRTNAQSRALEESFMHSGIPYVIVGGLKFYERREIKDIIAYLRLISNVRDSVSLRRIINVPKRGIGQTTISKLDQFAESNGLSMFEIISDTDMYRRAGLPTKARQSLYQFAVFIHDCIERQHDFSVPELVMYILNASGYLNELEQNLTPENEARRENLGEFVNVAKEFASNNPDAGLDEFLNHIALITDLDNLSDEKNCVSLMTVHSAKGLEFPIVFVTGLEEGLFPHSSAMMDNAQLEEERRAMYVALTRAQKKLYLSWAIERSTFGKERINERSRFIDEVPTELLTIARGIRSTVERPTMSRPSTPMNVYNPVRSSKVVEFRAAPKKNLMPNVDVNWSVGDRAGHVKWGNGTIIKVEGSGENAQLTVQFDDASVGKKTLIVKYAPIKKI